jgi:hypothetical protein
MHPRQIATEKGEKYYQGRPCKKCGNKLRYTSMTGCVSCTKENSIKRFENGDVKKWVEKNREKVNSSNRKRYKSLNLEEKKIRNRKQQVAIYGLTLEQYDAMIKDQNEVCALCGKPETNIKKQNMCIDHDHITGEVRALLCDRCNRGIGSFNDDIDLLEKAIAYLYKFKK